MRASRVALVALLPSLFLMVPPVTVCAQTDGNLEAFNRQVEQLYQAGNYAEAVPVAERYVALAKAQYGDDHTEFATAISWLGFIYRAQGRYAEAEPLHKHALAIQEKALGPDHADVAASLNYLATVHQDQGRYAEAEPLY